MEHALVRMTVSQDGDGGVVEIYNRGRPLPDEVRERMFEPFYTTREKGTGLGLAFVKEIVDDHGGSIEVESREDETIFRLRL